MGKLTCCSSDTVSLPGCTAAAHFLQARSIAELANSFIAEVLTRAEGIRARSLDAIELVVLQITV